LVGHVDAGLPAPIAGEPFAGEHFVRYPVTPQPLTGFAARQILHPFMAFEGGGLHGNAYNSDVHVTGGPLGNDLQVKSRSVSPLPRRSRSPLPVRTDAMCASFLGFEIDLFDPRTLNLLATHKLATRPSTFPAAVKLNLDLIFLDTSGGSYFYLDDQDRAVLADAEQRVQRIAHRQKTDGTWEFYVTDSWDMAARTHRTIAWTSTTGSQGECDPSSSDAGLPAGASGG
jgi:hypothetical protein